jgi:predicted amidophosphoribosyltransferase
MLEWALIGALIGLVAALKKGFNAAGGILGGALLGPLAFLMFFITGISSADANRRKCPYCAEWVKNEAVVCKHCGKDLPPTPANVTRKGRCTKCGGDVPLRATSCPKCSAPIGADRRIDRPATTSSSG